MKRGAHSHLTPGCVTLAELLPSLLPGFPSTQMPVSAFRRAQGLGISHKHTRFSFRRTPQVDGSLISTPLGQTPECQRPLRLGWGGVGKWGGGSERGGLLTVPEFTYFFFFIFFFGFITYRGKLSQGRFRAPTSPGCDLGTSPAGYRV